LVILTAIAGLAAVVMNLGRTGLPLAPLLLFAGLGVALLAHYGRAREPVPT
jgi:energy-converting hydrogenase Eha subunit A